MLKLAAENIFGIHGGVKIGLSDDFFLWQPANDYLDKFKMTPTVVL